MRWRAFHQFRGADSWMRWRTLTTIHTREINRPHWYLWALGVAPEQQGLGIGASLLQPVLEASDAAGVPCYLETQHESNLAFYRKQGFQVVCAEVVPALGLMSWSMLREPTGQGFF